MPNPRDTERLRATIDAVHAPPQLHARIAEQLAAAEGSRRRQHRRWSLAGGLVAAAAAAAAIVAIALPGGGAPTVLQVARLSAAPATRPAPPLHARYRHWLEAHVGGIWFPSARDLHGWRPTGARSDAVGGRTTMTVYYAGPGAPRVAYTIVAGGPLAWPPHARAARRGTTTFRIVRGAGRTVVTWREGGRQCVIAAPASVGPQRLLALAGWAAADTA